MSRLGINFMLFFIMSSVSASMTLAQPDAARGERRGEMLYRQAEQTGQETQTDPYLEQVRQRLEDPNQIRLRLQADPNLSKALEALVEEGKAEDARWVNRRARVKAAFVIGARKLLDKDFALIAKIANEEDANQIAEQVTTLQDQWKSRFTRISREIRMAMRAESVNTQADRMTRSRGRRVRQDEGRSRQSTGSESDNEPAAESEEIDTAEQEENIFVENWVSAEDDSTDTLYSELEYKVLEELARVRQSAETMGKTRTVNAVDGVLLTRKERSEQAMATYRERLQERQDEVNSVGNDTEDMRRGRGRRGQTGGNDSGRRRR